MNLLSFEQFVALLVQRLEQVNGVTAVAFDSSNQAIRCDFAGNVQFVRPQNAYVAYQKSPQQLAQVISTHLAVLAESRQARPTCWEEAAQRLLPMVRDRRYLDLTVLSIKVSGQPGADTIAAFPSRALAGELAVTLVLDAEASLQQVTATDLQDWAIAFDAALDRAMQNFRAQGAAVSYELVAPGVYALMGEDPFNASRLLLSEHFQALQLAGEPVVCVPSRGELLLADPSTPKAVAAMARLAAARLGAAERPLSADMLQFSGGQWVAAPPALARQPALIEARHLLMHRDYQRQADLLNRLYQAKGKDVFVATYKLGRKGENEPLFNYAQLTSGGSPTLLPKADHLALLTDEQELIVVLWVKAAKILGAGLQKVAVFPPRYLVKAFPTAAQVAELRAQAVIQQTVVDPAQAMREAAEAFRLEFEQLHGTALAFDEAGVQALDAYLQRLHEQGGTLPALQLAGATAFLGQIMVEQLKGRWAQEDGQPCVVMNTVQAFPQTHINKQLQAGHEGGESILGNYRCIVALETQKPIHYRMLAADPRKAAQLEQVRQKLVSLQATPDNPSLLDMRAVKPGWMESLDNLNEVFKQQRKLLQQGKVVWAALVMANSQVFKPGRDDCPGLLIYSLDPYYDARPQELHEVAQKIYQLKNTKQEDPELARLADLVTGEADRSMGWRVPEELSLRDVRGAIFMVFRKHIPKGLLQGSQFPILVHPDTQAVMLAPFELWPVELIRDWKTAGAARSLEDIRELPEAIKVSHTPAIVPAAITGADGDEFIWEFATQVEALDKELCIVEFGAFTQVGDEWVSCTITGKPFSASDFADWYQCPEARLKPGTPAIDRKNWSRRKQLTSARVVWYYIGRDGDGNLVRGEAEVEQRGSLIPPDSTAPKRAPSGGVLSKLSRMFSANEAEDWLRFDGVYRAKYLPMHPDDNKFCYLRLLPDNMLLFGVSADPPSSLTSWFNLKSRMATVGSYKLKGDSIQLEVPIENGSLVFNGSVAKNRLLLNSRRFSDLPTHRDEFLFMGWRP